MAKMSNTAQNTICIRAWERNGKFEIIEYQSGRGEGMPIYQKNG